MNYWKFLAVLATIAPLAIMLIMEFIEDPKLMPALITPFVWIGLIVFFIFMSEQKENK